MPITVPCLKCKTKFQVPSKLAGTTVRCQTCGFMLRLPSAEKIQAKKQAIASGQSPVAARSSPTPKRKPAATQPAEELYLGTFDLDEPFDLKEPATTGQPGAAAAAPEPPLLSCSHCAGLLYYDRNFANQTVACPHCGNHLVMPEL